MEKDKKISEPDNPPVQTTLWRALHLQVDAKPHILKDEIGLKLVDPPPWRSDQDWIRTNAHFWRRKDENLP